LMNDDTIADPQLLANHLKIQQEKKSEKWAVLGAFRPSEESVHRPLCCWINHSSFLFPQNTLQSGAHRQSAYFITCNLSLRRAVLLEAGNFDAAFRVAEDTEMGTRLAQRGYGVWFEPELQATHEHGPFTANDLVRRARAYGEADWKLFRKHPELLGDGRGPFGLLRERDIARLRENVERNREAVAVAFTALQKTEQVEMKPLFEKRADGGSAAEELWRQLGKVVPLVYWQYLFDSFLAARQRDLAASESMGTTATAQFTAVR
jgi:GT2 family glycosyltransferase